MTFRTAALGSAALLALAGCADEVLTTAAPEAAQFANGPRGVVTVTSLDDPGDGVCTADHCTLREAIAKAQPGDRIVFKSALSGTIALAGGELLIDRPVRIEGGGRITVDAQHASRVMSVEAGVVLDGLQLTNGAAAGWGGGIWAQADLTLINSTVTESSATGLGGGILFQDGTLTIRGSHIDRNTSGGPGGGLYIAAGTVLIDRSTVNGNRAGMPGAGANGGGIFNSHGTTQIVNSLLMDNTAVWSSADDMGHGGGIYNRTDGAALMEATTIAGNTAGGGGGILSRGTLAVIRSTVSGNTATVVAGGGGIAVRGGSATVRSATVVGNQAVPNTGMGVLVSGSQTRLNLANSVVAGHVFLAPTPFTNDCSTADGGTIVSLGYNLSSTCVGGATDVLVSSAQVFTEVVEAELRDNGGPGLTHALIERGRAIDAGYCPGEITDQRGMPRPFDDTRMSNARDGCDIGAFEWRPAESPASGNTGKGPKK